MERQLVSGATSRVQVRHVKRVQTCFLKFPPASCSTFLQFVYGWIIIGTAADFKAVPIWQALAEILSSGMQMKLAFMRQVFELTAPWGLHAHAHNNVECSHQEAPLSRHSQTADCPISR